MRTSELIAALAADPVPEPIRLERRIAAAVALGLIASVAIYALLMGPRPDIAEAARTVRFNLKFVDAFAFALPSLLLVLRLARPDARWQAMALWLHRAVHPARGRRRDRTHRHAVERVAPRGSWATIRCFACGSFRCWPRRSLRP